jgi:hypothetical protein
VKACQAAGLNLSTPPYGLFESRTLRVAAVLAASAQQQLL